jgi:hypothetical protein
MEEELATPVAQQNWRTLYNAALTEQNPAEQRQKIDLANGAIHRRLYELAHEQVNASAEQQAIIEALQTMQAMQGLNSNSPVDAARVIAPVAQGGTL